MTAPTATQRGVYQGYPYTNPLVIDAPSIDAETASKWANLPRNPIVPIRRPATDTVSISVPENGSSSEDRTNTDVIKVDELDVTRVYIDFPTNELGEYVNDNSRQDGRRENGGTVVNSPDNAPSNFLEDTIFYDPFEDRRIDVGRNQQATRLANGNCGAGAASDDATSAGSSNLDATSPARDRVPPFMSKESYVYGPRPGRDDRLLTEPSIPASAFPEPPPAYTETHTPAQSPPPPRTEVVVPDSTDVTGQASPDRKLVSCPFCDRRVYTIVIYENGPLTHVLAIIFIFVFAPIVLLVYCTDYFKYRNHYCPNCTRLVGYEVPILCQEMIYSKPE